LAFEMVEAEFSLDLLMSLFADSARLDGRGDLHRHPLGHRNRSPCHTVSG
jgi:hypothetical protein